MVAQAPRKLGRSIAAATINHDYLVAASAQWRKRLEGGADAGRLVQRGDDDRESLSAQS